MLLRENIRTVLFIVSVASSTFTGCTCGDDEKQELELVDDPQLRVDARVILVEHCGDCHMQDSPRADKHALAAIDFTKMRWAAGLDPIQSRRIIDNLASGTRTRGHEAAGGHYGAHFAIPPGQYMIVRDYLASLHRPKHVSSASQ